jgi:hypothetical protein
MVPVIDKAAAVWATSIVSHQARRMLHMVDGYVAENSFHADSLKLLRKLQEAPDKTLAHSVVLKRMKMDAESFGDLIATLKQQGDVEEIVTPRGGTYHRVYRLAENGVVSEET